jgi:HlyD family secretion protein
MKYLKSKWTIVGAIVTGIVLLAAFSFGRGSTPQYFTAKVARGDIRDLVQATGTINAVTTVQVGSQVSGTISKLYVDFNSHVKKGQVIAEIDPSLFKGALLQAQADLQNANATSGVAKAELQKAAATAEQTQADYARTVMLAKEGVMSQQQLEVSKANNDAAQAAVSSAKAAVAQANAQVAQKSAAVQVAQTNVNNTIIRSPIDGVVINRAVDVGVTVAASLQAPNLFSIAQDLGKMQVDVSTDESDVGQIKVGQDVSFKVDAFPKDVFRGRVVQVRMNPTTVQNVVTYDTVVAFNNPDGKLFPGMTAYISIPVAQASNVVEIPNAALRYQPSLDADQLQAIANKYGVSLKTRGKGSSDTAVIWKLAADKTLEPVQIKAGITDHTNTEVAQVLKGTLDPADQVVIGSANAGSKPQAATTAPGLSPAPTRMGGGRGGR